MKALLISSLMLFVLFKSSLAQYSHFNIQTNQGMGMQFSECGTNYTTYGLLEATTGFGTGTHIKKLTLSAQGNISNEQTLFLGLAGAPPSINPEEVILKVTEDQFVATSVRLNCGSMYPRLFSFNNSMELSWELIFSDWISCDYQEKFYPSSLMKCDDECFTLLCSAFKHNENNIDDYGYRLTKIDIAGNLLFDQVYYSSDFQLMQLFGGEKIQDGYIVWGQFARLDWLQTGCQGDIINGVMKLNEDGTLQDIYFLDDDDDIGDGSIAMDLLPNGNLIGMYHNATEQNCDTGMSFGKPRVVVLDVDDLDNPVHDFYLDIAEIDGFEFYGIHFQDIKVNANDGFVGLCHFNGTAGDVKSLLIHINNNFEMDWYTFLQAPNSPIRNFAQTVNTTPDGGYFVGGYCSDAAAPLWYLKLDACGYIEENGCPAIIGIDEINSDQVQCSPNPFNDLLQVKMDEPIQQILITDITGRVVLQQKANQVSVQLELSHLSSGSYLLRCTNERGEVVVEKLVKE
jgi:hypothetical protein